MRRNRLKWTKEDMMSLENKLESIQEVKNVHVLDEDFLCMEFTAANRTTNVSVRIRIETQNQECFGQLKVELYDVDQEFIDIFFLGMKKLRALGLEFSRIYPYESSMMKEVHYFNKKLNEFMVLR